MRGRPARPVPDVLLYDNEQHTTPVIIEVCHTSGVRNDAKKIMRLMDEFATVPRKDFSTTT